MATKVFVLDLDVLSADSETVDVLKFLQEKRDLLMLVMNKKKNSHTPRLSSLNAGQRFFKVIFTNGKDGSVFGPTREKFDCCGYAWYCVSNDYAKVIVPALEAQYTGVLVSGGNPQVEGQVYKNLDKVAKSRCLIIRSLNELVERYGEL